MSIILSLLYTKHIIRKDLLNKCILYSSKEIPIFSKIELVFQSNQKKIQISDLFIYNWAVVLEYLSNTLFVAKSHDKIMLDYMTHLENFKVYASLYIWDVFFNTFFFFIYFLWFRSLLFVTEKVKRKKNKGYLTNFLNKELGFKQLDFKTDVSFFEYNAPVIKIEKLNKNLVNFSTVLNDLSFLFFIPLRCTNIKVNFYLNFLTQKKENIFLLLSAYKFLHRINIE